MASVWFYRMTQLHPPQVAANLPRFNQEAMTPIPREYHTTAKKLKNAGFWIGIFRDQDGAAYWGCRGFDEPDCVIDMRLAALAKNPVTFLMEEILAQQEYRDKSECEAVAK